MQPFIRILAIAAFAIVPFQALPGVELLMGEEEGCIWCARWDAEIGPAYPKTAEGRAAPLRRVDIHDRLPADLELKGAIRFTPTFVLIDDGREISRLEGYPGEDFFWPLVGRMLDSAIDEISELEGWRILP